MCPGYQSQSGSLACMLYYVQWIPSGATPAYFLPASKVVKPFLIHILAHVQALVGLEPRMDSAIASHHVTEHTLLTELCRLGIIEVYLSLMDRC